MDSFEDQETARVGDLGVKKNWQRAAPTAWAAHWRLTLVDGGHPG